MVLNAMDAAERGAVIRTRTRCERARRERRRLARRARRRRRPATQVRARALVNAAGPWVSSFLSDGARRRLGQARAADQGLAHRGAPALPGRAPLHPAERRQADRVRDPVRGRVQPDRHHRRAFEGDPARPRSRRTRPSYLCRVVNRYFRREIAPADVVWSYAGVRPLYDDASGNASAVTRDYVFDLDAGEGRAPLLSDLRRQDHDLPQARRARAGEAAAGAGLQRAALDRRRAPARRRHAGADFAFVLAAARREHPWVPEAAAARWARAYGTRLGDHRDGASRLEDLGATSAAGCTRPRSTISSPTNGRGPRTTSSGGARARPACRRGHGGRGCEELLGGPWPAALAAGRA